jgi:2,4-dichlorophenol 6-monooxygenase
VERAPVAKQIVTRANQSIGEFGPIFEALGMGEGVDPEVMKRSRPHGCALRQHRRGGKQRDAIREAIAFKKYEFDAHGVEMNQRYKSDAIVTDGQPEPAFDRDQELHYHATTWPGARIPHCWLFDHDTGNKYSTLDLCGGGKFTVLTAIGGEAWEDAAKTVGAELGQDIAVHVIGPRRKYVDHTGDWARANEITDRGCVLVRPDQHVAWRSEGMADDPAGELRRVLKSILAK